MSTTSTRAPKPRRNRADTAPTHLLAFDALPCRSCGLAVQDPDPARTEVLEVFGRAAASAYTRGMPVAPSETRVTRCDECTSRRDRAEALVTVHGLGQVFGTVAADKVDAALAALDLIGIRGDKTAILTRTPNATRELVDAVAHIGAAASWSAQVLIGGDPDHSGLKRWSGVNPEFVKAAGEAYRDLIHRRTEVAMPFAPPSDGVRGCLMCGVDAIIAKDSTVRAAWGERQQAYTDTLGGRARPEPVKGYVCPTCRESVEEAGGAVGMAAVERAVLRTLGFRLPWGRIESWPGVVAWVALKAGTPPNKTPWAHLRLDALKRAVEKDFNFQPDERIGR